MFIGKSECRQNLCLHQNSAGHLHSYKMGLSEIHLCCINEFQLSGLDTDAVDKKKHVKANRSEVAVSTFPAMMEKTQDGFTSDTRSNKHDVVLSTSCKSGVL